MITGTKRSKTDNDSNPKKKKSQKYSKNPNNSQQIQKSENNSKKENPKILNNNKNPINNSKDENLINSQQSQNSQQILKSIDSQQIPHRQNNPLAFLDFYSYNRKKQCTEHADRCYGHDHAGQLLTRVLESRLGFIQDQIQNYEQPDVIEFLKFLEKAQNKSKLGNKLK